MIDAEFIGNCKNWQQQMARKPYSSLPVNKPAGAKLQLGEKIEWHYKEMSEDKICLKVGYLWLWKSHVLTKPKKMINTMKINAWNADFFYKLSKYYKTIKLSHLMVRHILITFEEKKGFSLVFFFKTFFIIHAKILLRFFHNLAEYYSSLLAFFFFKQSYDNALHHMV